MGAYSVALGQALADVLSGKEPPSYLACANAASDVRATEASEKAKFASLGPSPQMVMVGLKVTLSSAGQAAGEDVSFLDARSLTPPNGKVTWVELTGQVTKMRMPLDDRARTEKIAAPLGPDLGSFANGLANGCSATLLTESDLDLLPYEVQKDERDTIMLGMKRVQAGLPVACRAAELGRGGWDVHFHHADAVFRGAGKMARVRSRMHIEGNGPCLGPVEVEQVIAGG
jgi:hypothetical protein